MDFKDIIKTNRSKLGLTLDDIARFVGVSGATVSRWESGDIENIRRDKIAKLAEILRVTPSYLMGWENDSGEQDLGLTALDVAKWLNASPEMVDAVMEDMGWPDATNPEILSKISAEVERRKIAQKHPLTWTHNLNEKLRSIGCFLDSTEFILGVPTNESDIKWIWFPDGILELSDEELRELDNSTDSFLRFRLQELREKHKDQFKPHSLPEGE